jgi:hypothetical protein
MKPKLKPPGTERLKLNYDTLLSTSAFKFNSRRHSKGPLPFFCTVSNEEKGSK